jgi:hypothetical protein
MPRSGRKTYGIVATSRPIDALTGLQRGDCEAIKLVPRRMVRRFGKTLFRCRMSSPSHCVQNTAHGIGRGCSTP